MTTEPTIDTLPSGTVTFCWPCQDQAQASIILQHGFADYTERWIQDYPFILKDLHALKIDVYALDMHGHGRSPGQRSIVHISKAVDENICLRRRLTGPDKPPLFLLGHSLGGLVTAGSVTRDPESLIGAVLIAPALTNPMTPVARRLVGACAAIIPTWQIPRKESPVETLSRDKEFVEKWRSNEHVFHGQVSFLLAATALETSAGIFASTNKWSIPTLVVHGDRDTYTEYKQSQKLFDEVESIDKEFLSIEGGMHDVFSDSPEAWEQIVAWFETRVKSRSTLKDPRAI